MSLWSETFQIYFPYLRFRLGICGYPVNVCIMGLGSLTTLSWLFSAFLFYRYGMSHSGYRSISWLST